MIDLDAIRAVSERVEQVGRATLILGDCRDILPVLPKVDAVVTDPPYGIDPDGLGYGRGGESIANDKDLSVCIPALFAAHDLLDDGYLVAFHSPRNAQQFIAAALNKLRLGHSLVWDKKAPGMGGAIRYQHECIAVFEAGAPKPTNACFSVLQYYRDATLHPHMKPLALMMKLVEVFAPEAGLVLDPFMGSGSTGCAAVSMGRDFIGCEIDPRHYETSLRRIEESQKQGDLFIESAA